MEQDLGFARDIRPLFNDRDVGSMSSHFDLSSYDDVSKRAEQILGRLKTGQMPCDGAWPPSQVQLFSDWIGAGKQP